MTEEERPEPEDEIQTPKHKLRYDQDSEPQFKYRQFLSLVLVVGFLSIGAVGGSYDLLEDLMVAPCLGCLGLYPNVQLEFIFDTANGQPHPDFILDQLKDEGPIFIEFTQNDENCPPCKRMRPKVKELNEEYNDQVLFIIININENEFAQFYKGNKDIDPITDAEENSIYAIYDIEDIAGGIVATPTYIIVTLKKDDKDVVRPSFAVGYGEYKEEDAQKTKEDLEVELNVALSSYYQNIEWYEPNN
jgi:thiol-disulfide isomerase/thioredoxin